MHSWCTCLYHHDTITKQFQTRRRTEVGVVIMIGNCTQLASCPQNEPEMCPVRGQTWHSDAQMHHCQTCLELWKWCAAMVAILIVTNSKWRRLYRVGEKGTWNDQSTMDPRTKARAGADRQMQTHPVSSTQNRATSRPLRGTAHLTYGRPRET